MNNSRVTGGLLPRQSPTIKEVPMRTGIYRLADGTLAKVERTETGLVVKRSDGSTVAVAR